MNGLQQVSVKIASIFENFQLFIGHWLSCRGHSCLAVIESCSALAYIINSTISSAALRVKQITRTSPDLPDPARLQRTFVRFYAPAWECSLRRSSVVFTLSPHISTSHNYRHRHSNYLKAQVRPQPCFTGLFSGTERWSVPCCIPTPERGNDKMCSRQPLHAVVDSGTNPPSGTDLHLPEGLRAG